MAGTAYLTARVHRVAAEALRRDADRQRAIAPTLEGEYRTAYGAVINPRANALAEADRLDRLADEHALVALDLELPPVAPVPVAP